MPGPIQIRRNRSSHDLVMQVIGRAIVSGRYPVGTVLPSKEDLMEELAVSITTIREALQTLAAKGMVAAKTKVGTRVLGESQWNMFDADVLEWRLDASPPSPFLAALFEIRQGLEPMAAALAAVRRNDGEVARLRELATSLDLDPEDLDARVDAEVAFHQLILEVARNPYLNSIGALIAAALRASSRLGAPRRCPGCSAVARTHHRIVDLIDACDPQGASDAMLAAIRVGWTNCLGPDVPRIADVALSDYAKAE